MLFLSRKRGFTLIELLVVVAIISLLSSIVIASLTSARQKSTDASILATAREIKSTLEMHRNEQTSFNGLIPGWVDTCSAGSFSGPYAAKARELCLSLISKTEGTTGTSDDVYIGAPQSGSQLSYTIIIRLPYQSKITGSPRYLCLGANGGYSPAITYGAWTNSGCYSDPANQ